MVFSTVGDILSTMGETQTYHDALGGYHEYRGGVQYCGRKNLLLFEHPQGTHDIPLMYHDIPTVLKLQKMISPAVLNTPTILMICPMCIFVSPRY